MTSRQISNKQETGQGQEIRQGRGTGQGREVPRGDAAGLPPTGWAVLGLLSFRGGRTGYELKKWADSSLRFFYWSPAISQIYAELRRLESLGFATSRRSGPEEPRATRRYTITEAGRDALAAWADGADDPGSPVLKHPLVLRVWLGHLAAPGTLRALVERHIERTRGELEKIRDARLRAERAERAEEWAFPRVALSWSERRHLAELELAEAMLEDLEGLEGLEGLKEPDGLGVVGRRTSDVPPPEE